MAVLYFFIFLKKRCEHHIPLTEQAFEADLVEAALAHVDSNQVHSTYNRTDYLERRIPMMGWWSEHIERTAQGSLSVTGRNLLKVV
ncbi:hypothetical protein UB37_16775 [Photobacterium iliopiscarium]|nr:hypothetical protein UB37_16775 [Photobacterium iliopiscarium]